MHRITKPLLVQPVRVRLRVLVVFSLLVLAVLGSVPKSQAGWLTCPPQVVMASRGRHYGQPTCLRCGRSQYGAAWWYLSHTGHIPLLRSLLLEGLWHLSGQEGAAWVSLIPWAQWLWHLGELWWPWLLHQPEWQPVRWLLRQAQSLMVAALGGLSLGALLRGEVVTFPRPAMGKGGGGPDLWMMGLGCTFCGREEPWAEVVPGEDGSYKATICGHFTFQVRGDRPFRIRLLMLFLRLLEVPGPRRGGRRPRDGRIPFIAQEKLAAWFGMPQPDISRIEKYRPEGNWADLLSLKAAEVLTRELMARIVKLFAAFPWWGVERVYRHLREQGAAYERPGRAQRAKPGRVRSIRRPVQPTASLRSHSA